MSDIYTDTSSNRKYTEVNRGTYNDIPVVIFLDDEGKIKVVDECILSATWIEVKSGKTRKLFVKDDPNAAEEKS
jgi:hypothetical protein